MYGISYSEVIVRLILSTILGGIIGFEREVGNRPAGLRTHILVSIGATLIMIVSKHGFGGEGDPARLAAQVVSGIGFLGAGTILRTGSTIKGLTTAASLWVCAGLGLAIGAGLYFAAIVSTILVLISLVILVNVENTVFIKINRTIKIIAEERAGLLGDIGTNLGEQNIVIKKINIYPLDENSDDMIGINLITDLKSQEQIDRTMDLLYNIKGVKKITID